MFNTMGTNLSDLKQIGIFSTLIFWSSCNLANSNNNVTYEEILEISQTHNYEDFKQFIEENKTNIESIELVSQRTDFDQKCSAYLKYLFNENFQKRDFFETYLKICQSTLMAQSLKNTTKQLQIDNAFIQDLFYITRTKEFKNNLNPGKHISYLYQEFKSYIISNYEDNSPDKFEFCLYLPKNTTIENSDNFCYQKFINFFYMHTKNDDNTHGLVQLCYHPKHKKLEILELHSFEKGLGTKILNSVIFLSKEYLKEQINYLTLNDQNERDGVHIPFYEKFGFEKANHNLMDSIMILDLQKIIITQNKDITINY